MKRLILGLGLALTLKLAAGADTPANLLVDGDFSKAPEPSTLPGHIRLSTGADEAPIPSGSNLLPGWSIFSGTPNLVSYGGKLHTLALGGGIGQIVKTQPGALYELDFEMYAQRQPPEARSIVAKAGGAQQDFQFSINDPRLDYNASIFGYVVFKAASDFNYPIALYTQKAGCEVANVVCFRFDQRMQDARQGIQKALETCDGGMNHGDPSAIDQVLAADFSWESPKVANVTPSQYRDLLKHLVAGQGLALDEARNVRVEGNNVIILINQHWRMKPNADFPQGLFFMASEQTWQNNGGAWKMHHMRVMP